jgi:hypothetical protein
MHFAASHQSPASYLDASLQNRNASVPSTTRNQDADLHELPQFVIHGRCACAREPSQERCILACRQDSAFCQLCAVTPAYVPSAGLQCICTCRGCEHPRLTTHVIDPLALAPPFFRDPVAPPLSKEGIPGAAQFSPSRSLLAHPPGYPSETQRPHATGTHMSRRDYHPALAQLAFDSAGSIKPQTHSEDVQSVTTSATTADSNEQTEATSHSSALSEESWHDDTLGNFFLLETNSTPLQLTVQHPSPICNNGPSQSVNRSA